MILKIHIEKTFDQIIENWLNQLRKGILELAILSHIDKKGVKTYGYELIKNLKKENIKVESNTIYPILRRLEKFDLIDSIWKTKDNHPRKFFKITVKGKKILAKLKNEWIRFSKNINKFIIKEE